MNNEKTKSSELELTLKNTILERDRVQFDLKKLEEERDKLKHVVEDLSRKLENLSRAEVRKSFLEEQLNSLNSLFISRVKFVWLITSTSNSITDFLVADKTLAVV